MKLWFEKGAWASKKAKQTVTSISPDSGALEILCQSSRISTTQGQTHGTNTRYAGNITTNS
jgi:hypothetical protein